MDIFIRFIRISLIFIPTYWIISFISKIYENKISSRIMYNLWKLILATFVLCNILLFIPVFEIPILKSSPITLPNNTTNNNFYFNNHYPILPNNEISNYTTANTFKQFNPVWIFAFIISVSICFSIYMIIQNRNLIKYVQNNSVGTNIKYADILEKVKFELNIKKDIKIMLVNNFNSPICFGIFSPTILIPIKYNYNNNEIELLIRHELIHIKNCDLQVKLISQVLQCLYWFNPIIYLFNKKLDTYCEWACDEQVLNSYNNISQYGELIIKHCSKQNINTFVPVLGLTSKFNSIKGRIINMKNKNKKQNKALAFFSILMVIIIVSLSGCVTLNQAEKSKPNNIDVDMVAKNNSGDVTEQNNIVIPTQQKELDTVDDISKYDNFMGYIEIIDKQAKDGYTIIDFGDYVDIAYEYFKDLSHEETEKILEENSIQINVEESIFVNNTNDFITTNNITLPISKQNQTGTPYFLRRYIEIDSKWFGLENSELYIPTNAATEIKSVADGKVMDINLEFASVRIQHNGYVGVYTGIQYIRVKENDEITKDTLIGYTKDKFSIDFYTQVAVDYDETKIEQIISSIFEEYKNNNALPNNYEVWPSKLIKMEEVDTDNASFDIIPLSNDVGKIAVSVILKQDEENIIYLMTAIDVYDDYKIIDVSFSIGNVN